jgi:hypothetical protein
MNNTLGKAETMNLLTPIKTIKQAEEIIGGLSETGKMPCPSYSISAKRCNIGSQLAKIEGSVCNDCYALKGNYVRYAKAIDKAHERRYESLNNPQWVDAMSFIINRKNLSHFRWHDSGDIQNMMHLINIVAIAEHCPNTLFWLPTKEKALVYEYERSIGALPANLIVRISSSMVDGEPLDYRTTSTVHTSKPVGHECKAYENKGKCGDCRTCWDSTVKNVSYRKH